MILITVVLISILLTGSWYAYHISFHAPKSKRPSADDPLTGPAYEAHAENLSRISSIMRRYPYEEIIITAQDGTKLYGRYYHIKDGAPVELLFHGYRSHPFRDCCGGHALTRKMMLNALVVDQRAHGSSGGNSICFGIKERYDCLSWTNYIAERFGPEVPIILSGLSMGAATVLMAADLPLPESVSCIIADSPYSSPAAIIEKVCRDRGYPVKLCRPFVHLGALIYGGFRLNASSANDAVRRAGVPVLLIHGEADDFVPCDMSLEIAANCASRVEVATFPDADHGLSYIIDPIHYEKVVCSFLLSIPKLSEAIPAAYIENLYKNM